MKVISIFNSKGGVGKSTLHGLLAFHNAHDRNLRVLAIDMDTQANSSSAYLGLGYGRKGRGKKMPSPEGTVGQLYTEPYCDLSSVVREGVWKNDHGCGQIDAVPGYSRLGGLVKSDQVDSLRKFVHRQDVRDTYDIIFIDCPPNVGPAVSAALLASTNIVIPVAMEEKAVFGLFLIREHIDSLIDQFEDFHYPDWVVVPNLKGNPGSDRNKWIKAAREAGEDLEVLMDEFHRSGQKERVYQALSLPHSAYMARSAIDGVPVPWANKGMPVRMVRRVRQVCDSITAYTSAEI